MSELASESADARAGVTEAAVDRVAALLHSSIGLRTDPSHRTRLRRSIRDEAASQGLSGEQFAHTVTAGSFAFQGLLNRVTVQETSFFRHAEQFEALARSVLPRLTPPIRIWSAGCANGQEPYSLAMVLEELGLDGTVLATDLSTAALERTRAGRYSARELGGISPQRLARHFTAAGADAWTVSAALASRVATMPVNLDEALPERAATSDIVFCRNVLIYFSPERARAFLDRVADAQPPSGVLFLGGAEAIWPISDRFDTHRVGDAFLYTARAAGRPAAPSGERRPDPAAPRRRPPRLAPHRATETRRRPAAPAPAPAPAPPLDDVAGAPLMLAGRAALDAGDHQGAVTAFRKCTYLMPDDPFAHLHLALALDALGDARSANRAYAAVRRALAGADPAVLESGIEGFAADELLRLVQRRSGGNPT